jgi:hypothetical protein
VRGFFSSRHSLILWLRIFSMDPDFRRDDEREGCGDIIVM